ncbi:MAG TPA: DsbA family protein [Candidatus Poseidoniales archaeon]|nr:MAG: DsbA family protein [Euryarchaeota archaeon]HIF17067.1 DsbA family protein [Candidatus Poseidoniales archaeon]
MRRVEGDRIPNESVLYYVADPMCSWCWGFREARDEVFKAISEDVKIEFVMGGLARDSDEPMPEETKSYVKEAWRQVNDRTGAEFNWDFWENCQPRRSTYPACRAVIAAADKGPEMFDRIQQAYYLEARNPSDVEVLCSLATELGLDEGEFHAEIISAEVETKLQAGFNTRRRIGAYSFPSLVLESDGKVQFLCDGYSSAQEILYKWNETGQN